MATLGEMPGQTLIPALASSLARMSETPATTAIGADQAGPPPGMGETSTWPGSWGERWFGGWVLDRLFDARPFVAAAVVLAVITDGALFVLAVLPNSLPLLGVGLPKPWGVGLSVEAAVAIGTLGLGYSAMMQAESSERGRRFASFPIPRMRVVDQSGEGGIEWFQSGATAVGMPTPSLILENLGQGPALDVTVALAWKTVPTEGISAVNVAGVAAIPWRPVAGRARFRPVFAKSDVIKIEYPSHPNELIIAVFARVRWTNPDMKRGMGFDGGLEYVEQTYKRVESVRPFPTFAATYALIGKKMAPPDRAFPR